MGKLDKEKKKSQVKVLVGISSPSRIESVCSADVISGPGVYLL
jgi:hypothetical protein